jgi:hypothetical protein
MPVTYARANLFLLCAGLALLLAACGGGSAAPAGQAAPPMAFTPVITPIGWGVQLPALPTGNEDLARTGSVAQQAMQLGKDTFEQSAGASPNGNSLDLAAATGALEYAMYQFHTANPPASITVDATPAQAGMVYWLALANYASFKWELAGPYTSSQMIDISAMTGTFTSPGGNVYGAVLAYNGDSVQIGGATVDYDDGQTGGADYLNDLQPLIASNCITCHGAGSFTGVELHAFWAVRQKQGLLVAQVVTGSHHLTNQADKDIVQAFVDGGGQYGQAVTYTTDITPLVNNRCSPCHTGGNTSGGVSWASYATAFTNGNNGLIQILSENMPKSGGPLTDAQKDIWQAWVDQGKQE